MSKHTDTRLTPPWLKEHVIRVLEGVMHDPCPVGGTDGLDWSKWGDRVYVNPPGSLKKEFAQAFADWYIDGKEKGKVLVGAWMHYDWDHSTVAWQIIHDLGPTYAFLNKRVKMWGPGKDGEERFWDVGRSQAVAVVGRPVREVCDVFWNVARIAGHVPEFM